MVKDNLKSRLDGNELDLSLSDLKEIPVRELATIPKATSLDLSCNSLPSLPQSFCTLKHLVKLDLSKNEIKELPTEFGNLTNLQRLDLYSNQLKVLPVSFHKLKGLRWLDLKNNPLEANLKAIAGSCADEKQCQACANKVIPFMTTIHEELEKEQEKKLKQEKKKEAAKKAAKEKKEERQRLQKKAEKERKKEERRQQRLLELKQENVKPAEKLNVNGNHKEAERSTKNTSGRKTSSKKKQKSNIWFWLLAVLAVVVALVGGLVWRYTGGDLSEKQLTLTMKNFQQDAEIVWKNSVETTKEMTKTAETYLRIGSVYVLDKTHTGALWLREKFEKFLSQNTS